MKREERKGETRDEVYFKRSFDKMSKRLSKYIGHIVYVYDLIEKSTFLPWISPIKKKHEEPVRALNALEIKSR